MWIVIGILSIRAFMTRKEKENGHKTALFINESLMFKFIYKIIGYIRYN